jgi:ribosome-associated translation inhibitor RaiA
MHISIHARGINAPASWLDFVKEYLQPLRQLVAISSAKVALIRQRRIRAPFHIEVCLAIPGPDIHAAASDPTFPAAMQKVVRLLRAQIITRKAKRLEKQKSNLQLGGIQTRRLISVNGSL